MALTPLAETLTYALAAAILGGAAAGAWSTASGVAVGGAVAGHAAFRGLRRRRTLANRRRAADAVLVELPGRSVPDALRWRADELTSSAHRRTLARHFHHLAWMARQSILISSVPVSLSTLRGNRELLEVVAVRIEDLRRPIAARGVVLLERLLDDTIGSPLYRRQSEADLRRELERASGAIEPS